MTSDTDHETTVRKHREKALALRPDTPYRQIAEELPNNPVTGEPYAAATLSKWVNEAHTDA